MAREPIIDLQRRGARVGTIRTGETDEKGNPTRRETFLLTSPAREVLEQAAAVFEAEVVEWSNDRSDDAFALDTGRDELRVMLPPFSALEQRYELYGSGGWLRRCDGVRAEVVDPKSGEVGTTDCLCSAEAAECKTTTRLSVVLTEVFSIGAWLLTTGSEYAARELPWAVDMLRQLSSGGGPVRAVLRLQPRTVRKQGEKFPRRFNVVVLDVDPRLAPALGPGTTPATIAPPAPAPLPAGEPNGGEVAVQQVGERLSESQRRKLFASAAELGVERERVREIAKEALGHGISEMTQDERGELWAAVQAAAESAGG